MRKGDIYIGLEVYNHSDCAWCADALWLRPRRFRHGYKLVRSHLTGYCGSPETATRHGHAAVNSMFAPPAAPQAPLQFIPGKGFEGRVVE